MPIGLADIHNLSVLFNDAAKTGVSSTIAIPNIQIKKANYNDINQKLNNQDKSPKFTYLAIIFASKMTNIKPIFKTSINFIKS